MARPRKQDKIELWLKGLLAAGRRKAEEVIRAGAQANYGAATLNRVKATLGIVSEREDGIWYWRDPAVAQPKAASEDKLDVLTHKVEELTRLSQVPVPVENSSGAILTDKFKIALESGKTREIDWNDPKVIASVAHQKQVQDIIKSADPFAVLEASDLGQTEQMLLLVRNHVFDLEGAGKPSSEVEPWTRWIGLAKQRVKILAAAAKQRPET